MPPSSAATASANAKARPRVAIVGGGVNGLGVGWRLAEAGCPVDIFERGKAGKGASWAAAGMLAAGLEVEPGEQAVFALNRKSQRLWPSFCKQLEAASGVDIGYRCEGSLRIALTRDDAETLRFDYALQSKLGVDVKWMNGLSARQMVPHLRPGVGAAVLSPDDHQVDNRRLVVALKKAFECAGGRLHETAPVTGIDVVDGCARGVVTNDRIHSADIVVWATGPWANDCNILPANALPPVRPIKGQMLTLQMDPERPLLDYVVRAPKAYLVPRRDGRLLIGATVEEAGFDECLTAGGVLALLEGAWQAIPAIEDLPFIESWAGFRPGSRDGAPILGPCAIDNLLLANGHHRHGILLAPLTSDGLSQMILSGHMPAWFKEFTIERFYQHREAIA